MKFLLASKLRKKSHLKYNQHVKQGQVNTLFLEIAVALKVSILKAILFILTTLKPVFHIDVNRRK